MSGQFLTQLIDRPVYCFEPYPDIQRAGCRGIPVKTGDYSIPRGRMRFEPRPGDDPHNSILPSKFWLEGLTISISVGLTKGIVLTQGVTVRITLADG